MARDRTFGIITFAGLGSIAEAEISGCSPKDVRCCRLSDHDLVLADMGMKGAGVLPELRIAEDVFHMLAPPVPLGTGRDLASLNALVTSQRLLEGLTIKNSLFHPSRPRVTTYNCFVKQDMDRRLRRKEIAGHVNGIVGAQFRRWKQADPAAVELWGFYVKEALHLGVRLSDERMRYHGCEPPKRRGALRPTIAAALVYLAAPLEGELIVDPMCGTGTILREGVARNPGATWLGGDLDTGAVLMARGSLPGQSGEVREWDATRLPLGPASVDCIICNLPFGKQYSSGGKNKALYRALLSNWSAKLRPGGRMVLLTSDSSTLERTLGGLGLAWRSDHRAKVLGAWADIYTIVRQ